MSRNWEKGSTRQWRRIRRFVLDRDNNICQLQLPGCTYRATHAHHTVDRAVAGDNPDLIVAACEHCNTSFGSPSGDDPEPKTWI